MIYHFNSSRHALSWLKQRGWANELNEVNMSLIIPPLHVHETIAQLVLSAKRILEQEDWTIMYTKIQYTDQEGRLQGLRRAGYSIPFASYATSYVSLDGIVEPLPSAESIATPVNNPVFTVRQESLSDTDPDGDL